MFIAIFVTIAIYLTSRESRQLSKSVRLASRAESESEKFDNFC